MKKLENHPAGITEIKLSYKNKVPAHGRIIVNSTETAYRVFLQAWNKDTIGLQEEFKVMLLNGGGTLLGICTLAKGGITSATVDTRLIYASALKSAATSVIVAHNHPSGDVHPSKADEVFTQKIKNGAELLDIRLLDHLVLTRNHWFSFANNGLLCN